MERTTPFLCIDFYLFLYDPDVDHICSSSTEETMTIEWLFMSCILLRYVESKIPHLPKKKLFGIRHPE